MNWDAAGAVGELIGAAAVVLTLFYLARQVRASAEEGRQNQAELRRTRYDALNQQLAETVSEWSMDPGMADIMFRGLLDLTDLSQVEVFRFYAAQQRYFRSLEALFVYSSEGGVLDWGVHGWRTALAEYVTFPGVRAYWEDRHHWFSEAFQKEVASAITDSQAIMAEAYSARSGDGEAKQPDRTG